MRGSKVSHYFRMQMREFCRDYIVAYNLTDDESTITRLIRVMVLMFGAKP